MDSRRIRDDSQADSRGFAENSRKFMNRFARIRDGFTKVRDGFARVRDGFARVRDGCTTVRREIVMDTQEYAQSCIGTQSSHMAIHADSGLTMRTKGTLLMKMVGDFVSSKLHSQPQ